MADSLTLTRVASHERFLKRVSYYMTKAAIAVIAELQVTVGHAARVTYSGTVLDGTASVLNHGLAVLTNATVAAGANLDDDDHGITDANMEFACNEMWNAMSGVETGA